MFHCFLASHACCAGFLGLGEWQLYSRALETFLRHVATHATLSKNSAVETFLTSVDVMKQLFTQLFLMISPRDKNGEER